jgi:hypothetical protein
MPISLVIDINIMAARQTFSLTGQKRRKLRATLLHLASITKATFYHTALTPNPRWKLPLGLSQLIFFWKPQLGQSIFARIIPCSSDNLL